MKKVKIIIFTLLIIIVFVFNGEFYAYYLDDFQNSFYVSTFAFDARDYKISELQIINDFEKAADKNDVDFFFVESKLITAFQREISIYGSEKSFEAIRKKGIKPGKVNSIFNGSIHISFLPFDQMTGFDTINNCYYLDGETKFHKLDAFKKELISAYGGGYPRSYGSDRDLWITLITVWTIVFTLALLVTLYHLMNQKRENAIRVIQGQDLKSLFISAFTFDLISYIVIAILSFLIVNHFTHALFKMKAFLLGFTIFLVFNTLLNLTIFKLNMKKHLLSNVPPKGLIGFNKSLKVVFMVLSIMILSSQFYLIHQELNLLYQKQFFESKQNYSYYNLAYQPGVKSLEESQRMNAIFNSRFQEKALEFIDWSKNLQSIYPVVIINHRAMQQLSETYPFIEEYVKGYKIAVLCPDHLRERQDIKAFINASYISNFSTSRDEKINTLFYDDEVTTVAINYGNQLETTWYKDPIIMYYDSQNYPELYTNRFTRSVLYDVPEETFQSFIDEFDLEHRVASATNVYEAYLNQRLEGIRVIRMLLVICLLIISLNFALTVLMIRMDYRYHAIELSLQKIHGYSLMSRHLYLFSTSVLSGMFSMMITFIIFTIGIDFIGNRKWLLMVGLALIILDVIYMLFQIKRIESKKIPTILKGEVI